MSDDAPTSDTSAGTADEQDHTPYWRRRKPGEPRYPALVAVLTAIALQLALPDQLVLGSRFPLPVLEVLLLVPLVIANPVRLERDHPALRALSLGLTGLIVVAAAVTAGLLVHALLGSLKPAQARPLLVSGVVIYLTNTIAYGLLFWELDRGGPAARAAGRRPHPDFAFAQMTSPDLSPPKWRPVLLDYLYLSFTNSTAFSPTDTMPLTRRAKVLMTGQSLVSLAVVVLVVAKAVNSLS